MGEAGDSPMPLVNAPLKPAQEHCQPQAHPLSLLGRVLLQPSLGLLHPLPRPLLCPANFLASYIHLLGGQSLFHPLSKQYLLGILSGHGGEENQRLGMLHWSQRRHPAGQPGKRGRPFSSVSSTSYFTDPQQKTPASGLSQLGTLRHQPGKC